MKFPTIIDTVKKAFIEANELEVREGLAFLHELGEALP